MGGGIGKGDGLEYVASTIVCASGVIRGGPDNLWRGYEPREAAEWLVLARRNARYAVGREAHSLELADDGHFVWYGVKLAAGKPGGYHRLGAGLLGGVGVACSVDRDAG